MPVMLPPPANDIAGPRVAMGASADLGGARLLLAGLADVRLGVRAGVARAGGARRRRLARHPARRTSRP